MMVNAVTEMNSKNKKIDKAESFMKYRKQLMKNLHKLPLRSMNALFNWSTQEEMFLKERRQFLES